jgi:hypothetical protein
VNAGPLDVAQIAILAGRLLVAEVLLRVRRLDQTAASFGMSLERDERPSSVTFAATQREARWLRNAGRLLRRWPWDRSCLRRSLLIGWILRRHDPELVVGSRLSDGELRAHAWVRVGASDLDAGARDHIPFD